MQPRCETRGEWAHCHGWPIEAADAVAAARESCFCVAVAVAIGAVTAIATVSPTNGTGVHR